MKKNITCSQVEDTILNSKEKISDEILEHAENCRQCLQLLELHNTLKEWAESVREERSSAPLNLNLPTPPQLETKKRFSIRGISSRPLVRFALMAASVLLLALPFYSEIQKYSGGKNKPAVTTPTEKNPPPSNKSSTPEELLYRELMREFFSTEELVSFIFKDDALPLNEDLGIYEGLEPRDNFDISFNLELPGDFSQKDLGESDKKTDRE